MPRGELSTGRHSMRHPLDWYVEEQWVTFQLRDALGRFARDKAEGLAVWDPCCGFGNTMVDFADDGFEVFLSDLVDNVDWRPFDHLDVNQPEFFHADFLELDRAPARCSIVCNPPYSYKPGIAEGFARQALRLATGWVCIVVPLKWLASQGRHALFALDYPPAAVLPLMQRPSMPPGDMIAAMGKRAFRGGTADYCWIVWDKRRPTAPGMTRTVWLPPLGEPIAPIEGLA